MPSPATTSYHRHYQSTQHQNPTQTHEKSKPCIDPNLSLPFSFSLTPQETPAPTTISPHRLHQSTHHPNPRLTVHMNRLQPLHRILKAAMPLLVGFPRFPAISSPHRHHFPIQNSPVPIAVDLKPCLFFLFASPISDQTIHTHEYRAYQFRSSAHSFDPKSIDIVNIGPAFRGHYGAFSPNSQLPALPCELRVSPMNVDKGEESLGQLKKGLKAQSELDMCAEGLEVSSLSRLMGSEAVNYTSGVEELYEKMLVKIESLARQVENSSAKIREQEDHNRKLRHKATRTAGL